MTRLTATSAFISSSPALPAARSTRRPGVMIVHGAGAKARHSSASCRQSGGDSLRRDGGPRRLRQEKAPTAKCPKPQQKIVNNSCLVKDFRTLAQPLLAVCYEARDSFWG